MSHTPSGLPLRSYRHPPRGGTRVRPAGPSGADDTQWAQAGGGLIGAAGITGIVGCSMLATGFRAASEVLVAGLLGVVAGVLLRHPSVADRVVAALLGLMLLPLLLTIALAVRLTSPGPVFVRQARDCATGRTSVLRFRTTFVDGGASSGQPDEARPTPIGRALRRWYLDALPGVVDVLKGDMSLFRPGPP